MTPNFVWCLMALAIAFETADATMLKLAVGFQRPTWFFGAIAAYVICFVFFAKRSGTARFRSRMRSGAAWAPS